MTDDQQKIEEQQALQKLRRYATEYMNAKELATESDKRRKDLREILLGMVESQGTKDETGNYWLPAIDHMIKGEVRQTVTFDAAKAEEWLRERGHWDEVKQVVPEQVIPSYETVDEDALARFLFERRYDPALPDDIPDEVYNRKQTTAIKVTKEEQYEY